MTGTPSHHKKPMWSSRISKSDGLTNFLQTINANKKYYSYTVNRTKPQDAKFGVKSPII